MLDYNNAKRLPVIGRNSFDINEDNNFLTVCDQLSLVFLFITRSDGRQFLTIQSNIWKRSILFRYFTHSKLNVFIIRQIEHELMNEYIQHNVIHVNTFFKTMKYLKDTYEHLTDKQCVQLATKLTNEV